MPYGLLLPITLLSFHQHIDMIINNDNILYMIRLINKSTALIHAERKFAREEKLLVRKVRFER